MSALAVVPKMTVEQAAAYLKGRAESRCDKGHGSWSLMDVTAVVVVLRRLQHLEKGYRA